MDKPCRGLKWIAIIIVPVHYYIIILLSSYGVFENLLALTIQWQIQTFR